MPMTSSEREAAHAAFRSAARAPLRIAARAQPVALRAAVDGDHDVVEGDVERGLGLVDADLDLLDPPVGEDRVGDPFGEGLQKVDGVALDHGDDGGGHLPVVDGVVQRVRDGGDGGAAPPQAESHVDDEELTLPAFGWQDAVAATGRQPGQPDRVNVGCGGAHRVSFHSEAVRTASRLAGTS